MQGVRIWSGADGEVDTYVKEGSITEDVGSGKAKVRPGKPARWISEYCGVMVWFPAKTGANSAVRFLGGNDNYCSPHCPRRRPTLHGESPSC